MMSYSHQNIYASRGLTGKSGGYLIHIFITRVKACERSYMN